MLAFLDRDDNLLEVDGSNVLLAATGPALSGEVAGEFWAAWGMRFSSSDTADSRLEDRSGRGMSVVAACGLNEFAGGERRSG